MCFSLQSIDINTGELTPSRRDRCSGLRPRVRYIQWTRSHVQDWNFYLAVWLSPIKWPENEIVFFGDHEDVGSANASNSKLAVMSKAKLDESKGTRYIGQAERRKDMRSVALAFSPLETLQ